VTVLLWRLGVSPAPVGADSARRRRFLRAEVDAGLLVRRFVEPATKTQWNVQLMEELKWRKAFGASRGASSDGRNP
jgi:hypothetical protein